MKQGFVLWGKTLQMAIHAGMSVGMSHIDSIAKAILVDSQTTDVAIGYREYLLTLDIARLDIDATMKVPGTGLAKIASQRDFIIDRRHIFYIRIADRLGIMVATCQQ